MTKGTVSPTVVIPTVSRNTHVWWTCRSIEIRGEICRTALKDREPNVRLRVSSKSVAFDCGVRERMDGSD